MLPPSGAQVATDPRPHRVRVYRSPEWDPRTTARVELALMGGVMTATLVTLGRWDWGGLCRAFVNAADETTPIVAGTPFTWLGMKRDRRFRDWCQSYRTQERVASTARAWLPDRF